MKGETEAMNPCLDQAGLALGYSELEKAIMVRGSLGRDYRGRAAVLAATTYFPFGYHYSHHERLAAAIEVSLTPTPSTLVCPPSAVSVNRKPITVLVAA